MDILADATNFIQTCEIKNQQNLSPREQLKWIREYLASKRELNRCISAEDSSSSSESGEAGFLKKLKSVVIHNKNTETTTLAAAKSKIYSRRSTSMVREVPEDDVSPTARPAERAEMGLKIEN